MIWWILTTLLSSFSTIFRKKSMNYWITWYLFSVFWTVGDIILILAFAILWFYSFENWNFFIIFLAFLISIISIIWNQISQYIYKNEKISVLTPYENLNKIFSIILAYIIFSDTSIYSFFITLLAWIFIIVSSIDFKNLSFPKSLQLFSFRQLLTSIELILSGYILSKITPIDYFALWGFFYILPLFVIIIWKKDFFLLKNVDSKFYFFRLPAWILWTLSYLISLFIIANLWVTMTVLFSFMYIWVILVLSYFFFKDIPTKKDIFKTIILWILVWFWFYLK